MKTILKIKKNLALVLLSITFFSCENNVEEEPIVGGGGNEPCDSNISFADNVKPIIDSRCVSCHNGNQSPDLRTYEGVSNNAQRVRSQVVSRRMPLNGSLSDDQIELIRCWIENGALNN